MLTSGEIRRPKLSTLAPWAPALQDNRNMKDASATGLGRFLTLSDTADLLNVSATQVSELVRSGELPAIRVGAHGQWRVERIVLEGYIDGLYEQARRMSLWNQSQFAEGADFPFGERSQPVRSR